MKKYNSQTIDVLLQIEANNQNSTVKQMFNDSQLKIVDELIQEGVVIYTDYNKRYVCIVGDHPVRSAIGKMKDMMLLLLNA